MTFIFIMAELISKKIIKNTPEDILEYLNKNETDTKIIKDIITQIENTTADALNNDLCVSVPYLGRLRRSPFSLMMKEGKILLHDAKQRLNEEEYKTYRKNLYKEYRNKCNNLDYIKLLFERLLRINKKQYNKIYSSCGKAYADMWIKKIGFFSIIEHDKNDPNEI